MDQTSSSFGYKGKGASGTDVTALRRKLAEARSYQPTDKKRGTLGITDINSFKPMFNVFSQVTGAALRQ